MRWHCFKMVAWIGGDGPSHCDGLEDTVLTSLYPTLLHPNPTLPKLGAYMGG